MIHLLIYTPTDLSIKQINNLTLNLPSHMPYADSIAPDQPGHPHIVTKELHCLQISHCTLYTDNKTVKLSDQTVDATIPNL